MNFLAPIFLAGAAAIVLPILFHLVRQSARRRTLFSSLMFLRPALPRLTRRNKLDHLLLLVLRGLIVVVLAVGFARPFIRKPVAVPLSGAPPKRFVVLIDRSASMQREGLWPDACQQAEAVARSAGPMDDLAVLMFDEEIVPRISFEEWRNTAVQDRLRLVRERVAGSRPGWGATRLDRALIRAVDLLEAEGSGTERRAAREIVLVSDLAEGSVLGELAGYSWPKDVRLSVRQLTPGRAENVGIHLSADVVDGGEGKAGEQRVRVICSGIGGVKQYQVGWADGAGEFVSEVVPVVLGGGQERVISVPAAKAGSQSERLIIRGDKEEYDDVVYVAAREREPVQVLGIGHVMGEGGPQPLYFLQRVFSETARFAVEVKVCTPGMPVDRELVQGASMVVVTGELDTGVGGLLREKLERGGTMLFVPLNASAAVAARGIPGCEELGMEDSRFEPYGLLTEIDTGHPLFAPFAEPRFGDFTKVKFWRYRKIDQQTVPLGRVIASFDNGDPAIIDVPVGAGRVLIFASGWHPADGQLALSSKFVPMMHAVLEMSCGAQTEQRWRVGQPVSVRVAGRAVEGPLEIVKPDGKVVTLGANEVVFQEADLPGIYTVRGGQRELRFAVNIDAAESRVTPLQLDELERLGVRMVEADGAMAARAVAEVRRRDSETESQQGLWRWFLAVALMIVFVESVVAGRAARNVGDRAVQVQS